MQGYTSRETALEILLEQESKGLFLKDLMAVRLDKLPGPDRALVRRIVFGVVRNRGLLDYNIDLYTAKKLGPGALRMILRLTAYQIFFMDVPDFAAVDVGVELVKRRERPDGRHKGGGKSGFVNAVLKRMAKEGVKYVPGEGLQPLAVNHSHPLWLVKRWFKRLGREGLIKALERNNQEAPLWIRVNPFRAMPEQVRAELAALGVDAQRAQDAQGVVEAANVGKPARYPMDASSLYLRLAEGAAEGPAAAGSPGEIALHSDLFAQGKISFQDPAACLVAELCDWRPGESLLDLCAAPGGKSAAMLERARYLGVTSTASLICNDLSFRRLRRIRDARERLGHQNLLPIVMDPAHPALRKKFDLIVVDAPCSNLGVIRRRPEAKWAHGPEDLLRLAKLQAELLAQAAHMVTPRGRIVYATCSPEEEEASEVVKAFLKANPGWRVRDAAGILPAWAVKQGFLWLHPGESEYDGFFAAHLERTE